VDYISLTCNATNLDLTNISLYTNSTGTWQLNQTVQLGGTGEWNMTFGTNGVDAPYDVIVDNNGDVYVVGRGDNLSYPGSGADWWIKKFDSDGVEITTNNWNGSFDAGGPEIASSVAIDNNSGDVYVVGYGYNLSYPGSGFDWWLKKFSSSGVEIVSNSWNASFDASGETDNALSVAVYQSTGDVYVAGSGQNLVNASSGTDWWIKKFNSSGVEDGANWNLSFDARGGTDIPPSVAVDQSTGEVYVVGYAQNLINPSSDYDWWIKKFNSSGTEITDNSWNSSFDNGGSDLTLSVDVDQSTGEVYVVGSGEDLVSPTSNNDWWIKKFNRSGVEITDNSWNSTFHHGSNDFARSVAVDQSTGDVYVIGWAHDLASPSSGDDWWLKKFNRSGVEIVGNNWNASFDGGDTDVARSVAVDSNGNVYAVGYGRNLINPSSSYDWWIKKFQTVWSDPAVTSAEATFNLTGLADGTHMWSCQAYDSSGNNAFAEENRTFKIDTTPPVWDQNLTNQTVEYTDAFYYDVNASDVGSGVDVYFIDNNNFTINALTGVIQNATSLEFRTYYLNISVNDTLGNVLSEIITVTVVDTTIPVVNLVDPIDNYNISVDYISLTCNATNFDLENISLYTNSTGTWQLNQTVQLGGPDEEWNLTFGGDGWDWAYSVAVDQSDGGVYVVGFGQNLSYPGSGADWWVKKFNSAGVEITTNSWNDSFYNGDGDGALSVAIDESDGNVYVVGYGDNLVHPSSDADWWLKKFNRSGVEIVENSWNGSFNHGTNDYTSSVAVDQSDGSVYVVGWAHHLVSGSSGDDWWVKKFNRSGIEDTANWNLIFDGGQPSIANSVAVDQSTGDVYVGGTGNNLVNGSSGPDWWVKKFNRSGVEITDNSWNNSFDGSGSSDGAYSVAVDQSDGSVYVVGFGTNLSYPGSGADWWVKKFNRSGVEITDNSWNNSFDGSGGRDFVWSVAVDQSDGSVYVVGYAENLSYPGSGYDWWVKKFTREGLEINNAIWNSSFDGNDGIEWARSVAVDSTGDVYVAGIGTNLVNSNSSYDWWIKKFESTPIVTSAEVTFNLTGVADGTHMWSCQAYDSSGNNAFADENRTFKIDTTPPVWDQNLTNQTVEYTAAFYYDVNASDAGSGVDVYFINDTTNFQINALTGVIQNATNLEFRTYYLNISVNDTLGNVLSEIISITVVDTTIPVVTLVSPVDNYNSSNDYISLTCNATNLDLTNISLYTNSTGTWQLNQTVQLGGPDEVWNISIDGGNDEVIRGIAVDSNDDVYMAGYGENLVSPSSGYDWWIKKFNSSGDEIVEGWNKSFDNGVWDDDADKVVVDGGDVYVLGLPRIW